MINLKKYIRPLNFTRRDREFYARHAQGPLSNREVLAIEYSHFPPKGWTVDDPQKHLDTPVNVYSPIADKEAGPISRLISTVMTLGYVRTKGGSRINIKDYPMDKKPDVALNKLIFSPAGQAGVAYISVLLATRFAPVLATMNPVTIFMQSPFIVLMGALTSLRNQPVTQLLTLPFRPAMDTVGHEFTHVLQDRDPHESKTGYNIFRNAFRERAIADIKNNGTPLQKMRRTVDDLFSMSTVRYFMCDYEIQARMHTLLVHNYPKWGRMPETRHEFWAAMIGAGLRAPREIHDELAASAEDVSTFYKPGLSASFNRAAAQTLAPHVAELNTAYWGLLTAHNRSAHWHNTLPYLYGHLTELCGDKNGLARMGYTGPVLDKAGPVPFLNREEFWNEAADDTYELADAKEIEAQRGLWIYDDIEFTRRITDFNTASLYNDDVQDHIDSAPAERVSYIDLRNASPLPQYVLQRAPQ